MRYLIVATAIAAAAAQTTNVESTYVEQVLNARGGGAIKYAGGNLNIDSLLQSYPECQSCSVSTPCAHRNLLGTGTCIGSSSRQVDGVKTSYCLDFDVCCGGNCRNSRRPTKKCSFQGNEIKTSLGNANFNSARSMLAYIQVDLLDTIPIAQVSNLITSVADESTLSARCSSSCNGWSWQGQLLSGSCPMPNADSFFSSGDKKLTQDANLGAIQGKVVCPKGYTCSKPDTCVSYETFETVKASTVVPTVAPAIINAPSGAATSSNSKSGSVVAIAVGASVVGLLAIGGAVFCFMRKKKSTDDDYHAMSEGTL
ncbi:hypothetical protein B5M09_003498 [Aphanomyces astaci]|uniref:Uncharacterized protein n=1 Tax=Aphanomyces astaci TaxID=112090 RepID=A0A3R7Y9K2_APHAT|nr:hypothetical protein B5M09_003498 [Aphanomyces astaci]